METWNQFKNTVQFENLFLFFDFDPAGPKDHFLYVIRDLWKHFTKYPLQFPYGKWIPRLDYISNYFHLDLLENDYGIAQYSIVIFHYLDVALKNQKTQQYQKNILNWIKIWIKRCHEAIQNTWCQSESVKMQPVIHHYYIVWYFLLVYIKKYQISYHDIRDWISPAYLPTPCQLPMTYTGELRIQQLFSKLYLDPFSQYFNIVQHHCSTCKHLHPLYNDKNDNNDDQNIPNKDKNEKKVNQVILKYRWFDMGLNYFFESLMYDLIYDPYRKTAWHYFFYHLICDRFHLMNLILEYCF